MNLKRAFLSLILASSASAFATSSKMTDMSMNDFCRSALAGLPHFIEASRYENEGVFPSGFRPLPPIQYSVMQTSDFAVFARAKLSQITKVVTEGPFSAREYLRHLHHFAEALRIWLSTHPGATRAEVAKLVADPFLRLETTNQLLVRNLNVRHETLNSEALSELIVINRIFSSIYPLDAALFLSHLIQERFELNAKLTEAEKTNLLIKLQELQLDMARVRPSDKRIYDWIIEIYDRLVIEKAWEPQVQQEQILILIEGVLIHAPIDNILPVQFEFARTLAKRMPRTRPYSPSVDLKFLSMANFVTRHEEQIIRYDPNLYNLLMFVAGFSHSEDKFWN